MREMWRNVWLLIQNSGPIEGLIKFLLQLTVRLDSELLTRVKNVGQSGHETTENAEDNISISNIKFRDSTEIKTEDVCDKEGNKTKNIKAAQVDSEV